MRRGIVQDTERTSETERALQEFPCLLELRIRPDRRYVRLGFALTVLLHGSLFGYAIYDSYRALSSWKGLIGLEIVSEPGHWRGLRLPDRALLVAPLYYPPGLLTSSADEEAKRRAEERRRRQEAARRLREHMEQVARAKEATSDLPKTWEELEQRVKDEARKLNIGPIRDAIVAIYRAKQEGRLAFQDISVAVSFRVQKDGALTDIALVEPSGVPEVDAAAPDDRRGSEPGAHPGTTCERAICDRETRHRGDDRAALPHRLALGGGGGSARQPVERAVAARPLECGEVGSSGGGDPLAAEHHARRPPHHRQREDPAR